MLTPTRELAIQVAEAMQKIRAPAARGFHVLPIYGGQAYALQLKPLAARRARGGRHPGRVMDHIRKGTLKLDGP